MVDWCWEQVASGIEIVSIYYVFVLYLFRISFVFGAGEEQAVGV